MRFDLRIADFPLIVETPGNADLLKLLPEFRPFVAESPSEDPVMHFRLSFAEGHSMPVHGRKLADSLNDLGQMTIYELAEGYLVTVSYGGPLHWMLVDHMFRTIDAYVCREDGHLALALTSLMRASFAQAIIPFGGISVHSSVVECGGKGYLFVAPSGTGKSTHSRQWLKRFPESHLVNDDNPMVRVLTGGEIRVYGSPWSGKTPCYRQESYPIGGIARIRQAPENSPRLLSGVESFVTFLPSCSALRQNPELHDRLCDTVVEVCEKVPVALMACLPDENAAEQCRSCLNNEK